MKYDIQPAPGHSGKNETFESQMRVEYEDWWEQQHPEEAAKQREEIAFEFTVPFHWHISHIDDQFEFVGGHNYWKHSVFKVQFYLI